MKLLQLVAILCFVSTVIFAPLSAFATPNSPGKVPEQVGNAENLRAICDTSIPLPKLIAEVIWALAAMHCHDMLGKLKQAYVNAYLASENEEISPGWPTNDVHMWRDKVLIQDFTRGVWGTGAIIKSANKKTTPYYVGGWIWDAFKRTLYEGGVWPGYPINNAHDWQGITIQDFRDGSWGDTAIITNNSQGMAHAVAGYQWWAYKQLNGPIALGQPRSFVYYWDNYSRQDFERGYLLESGGTVFVYLNSEGYRKIVR
jgi:hypothetical protein